LVVQREFSICGNSPLGPADPSLLEGKTVQLIAHRLRIIAGADNIVVLDKGQVAEQGSHDSLLARDGLYCGLYTLKTESLGWPV
jgi:ATP-binding cassette subfamily B protein